MTTSITRSEGIFVPGWIGPRPGGGMAGATSELDEIVQKAAEALADFKGWPIEIRFNSDRRSGGAYLKDEPATLGVCARYEFTTEDRKHTVLVVHVNANAAWLKDPAQATSGPFGSEYAFVEVASASAAAIAWIENNCLAEKVVRVPPATLKRWERRRIHGEVDGEKISASFLACVEGVGGNAAYMAEHEGRALDEAQLAAWFRDGKKVSAKDARDVARAVFQVRPWGFGRKVL